MKPKHASDATETPARSQYAVKIIDGNHAGLYLQVESGGHKPQRRFPFIFRQFIGCGNRATSVATVADNPSLAFIALNLASV